VILWRITNADSSIASVRYRAVLPALHLSALGYESRFLSRHESLPRWAKIDAVVFVKAFSEDDFTVAQAAASRHIRVVLDICDNIFVEGYSSFGARANTFRKMASIASAIVTTGPALARVLRTQIADCPEISVIPDGVETNADREQIQRVLPCWQLYGPAKRTYYRARARVRKEGWLLFLASLLVATGAAAAHQADRIPGRPLRFITGPARAIFRASRFTLKHGLNLTKIVIRRTRQEGLGWIFHGLERRVRRLADRLSNGAPAGPVIMESVMTSFPVNSYDAGPRDAREGTIGPTFSELEAATPLDHESGLAIRTLIWFGNQGAPYAQFGLRELASLRPVLCAVATRHRIQLIVVSNSEARFNELMHSFTFPTLYVSWRLGVVEELFKQSEIALLPNSLDAFSVCKSANRAVLALHHGIPVVATRTPALEPFEGCMIFDDWIGGIETYLNDKQLGQQHVADAQAIIHREFSGKRIAAEWDALLQRVCSNGADRRGVKI
jgi:glycosyltransferase involved in cell wall biosynthesis